jgi:hypothetical protein
MDDNPAAADTSAVQLRNIVDRWFDGAQVVARKLNEIDSDIAEWYRFHLDRDNLVMAEIPRGKDAGTYGDWIDEMYGVMRERIDTNIASAGKLISQLEAIKSKWIGDRLLLAFPALGFFESQNQKWKSAWERLLWAHEMIGFLWPQVIKHVDSIFESRRLCDLSYLELSKGMTTAVGVSTGALRDADLKLIEERLFTEMAEVIRDLRLEGQSQVKTQTTEAPAVEVQAEPDSSCEGKGSLTQPELTEVLAGIIKLDPKRRWTAEELVVEVEKSKPGRRTSETSVGDNLVYKEMLKQQGRTRNRRPKIIATDNIEQVYSVVRSSEHADELNRLISEQERNDAADRGRKVKGRRIKGTD